MGTINQLSAGGRNLTRQCPSADVPAVSRKRRYSEAYKLRILEEADACKRGELGALLRREGLHYASINGSKDRDRTAAVPERTPCTHDIGYAAPRRPA